MTIYVVINDDGDPEIAFRTYTKAVDYCRDRVVEQDLDADEWDCYYRLYEVELNG